jgi:ankyrin repeat protein
LYFQDAEANTPLHIAIINQHMTIINLLISAPNLDLSIRNKQNQTPFACSMVAKNNEAAKLIIKREPRAAEQVFYSSRKTIQISLSSLIIKVEIFFI